jgi:hypothetical protein
VFRASKIFVRTKELVDRWLSLVDQAICAREDEQARRHGWQITRTGLGARRYRDPRFDLLKPGSTDSETVGRSRGQAHWSESSVDRL